MVSLRGQNWNTFKLKLANLNERLRALGIEVR